MAQCPVLVSVLILLATGGNSASTGSLTTSAVDTPLNVVDEIRAMKAYLNTIETRLVTLQTAVEQISTYGDLQRCQVRSIAQAIRGKNYKLAEKEISEMNNDDFIATVIHETYANSVTNADTILDFAKTLQRADTKYLIFNALRDEMRSSEEHDPLRVIHLIREVRKLLRGKDVNLKAKAQALIEDAVEDIKSASVSIFKAAMIANTFQDSTEVKTLANALFDFRSDLSTEVLEEVVGDVIAVVDIQTLIGNIASLEHIRQVIPGLTDLLNRASPVTNLTDDDAMELASHLQSIKGRANYADISAFLKDDFEELVRRLPLCVRSLFFAKKVCLWNRGRGMYLYATDSFFRNDNELRYIGLSPNSTQARAAWTVKRVGKDVYLTNVHHTGEEFYSSYNTHNDDKRYVFSWLRGELSDDQRKWSVEFDGEYCYIKSPYRQEYLFVSDTDTYVFTSRSNKDIKSNADYQWQLHNCDHVVA